MSKKWKWLPNIGNAFLSRRYPVSLINFITQRCNARCPHCFLDFSGKVDELSAENIAKIADTSGPCLRNIALTGGEPFLREDISDIVDAWLLNSTAQSMTISTNGSMPDRIEKLLQKATRHKKQLAFSFSYDLIGKAHSDYRKVKDLHLTVIESQKIVLKHPDTSVTFQITLSPGNVDVAEEVYDHLIREVGAKSVGCIIIRGENADSLPPEMRQKLADTYVRIQQRILHDSRSGTLEGLPSSKLTGALINAKNKFVWQEIHDTFVSNRFIAPCRAGSLFGIIYADGDVAPCETLPDRFGNLRDNGFDLMQLWNSEKAEKIRKRIVDGKCRCTYECSWIVNIFSAPRYYPKLLVEAIRQNF